jgi:hypothetical protein
MSPTLRRWLREYLDDRARRLRHTFATLMLEGG